MAGWHAATNLWGRDKKFGSGDGVHAMGSWLRFILLNKNGFVRRSFFHNRTKSNLTSSTWNSMTFKTHTHTPQRKVGVSECFRRSCGCLIRHSSGTNSLLRTCSPANPYRVPRSFYIFAVKNTHFFENKIFKTRTKKTRSEFENPHFHTTQA